MVSILKLEGSLVRDQSEEPNSGVQSRYTANVMCL